MAIYKNPFDELLASIAKQGVPLTPSEYDISAPVPMDEPGEFDNTEIEIVAKDLQSTFSGRVKVTYRRLPLSEIKTQAPMVLPCHTINSTRDIYRLINRHYGTAFTDHDIEVRQLTAEEKTIPSTIVIQAKPGSYGWVGSLEVGTRLGGYELSDHVTTLSLGGFDYPGSRVTKPFGHMYSYWRDFTSEFELLQTVELGNSQVTLEALAEALSHVTGNAWQTTGRARYSLEGAVVTEIDTPYETNVQGLFNNRYEHAIKVELDDDNTLGLGGYLVLHYNTPVDLW